MTAFLIILILLLIFLSIALFFYFDTKLREIRKQYRLLNNQYISLKKNLSTSDSSIKNLKIKYINSNFSSGINKENTIIYLIPLEKSNPICTLNEASDLNILEQCSVDNIIWLYIEFESIDNINCRGWVQKKDFSFLKDKIQII